MSEMYSIAHVGVGGLVPPGQKFNVWGDWSPQTEIL